MKATKTPKPPMICPCGKPATNWRGKTSHLYIPCYCSEQCFQEDVESIAVPRRARRIVARKVSTREAKR